MERALLRNPDDPLWEPLPDLGAAMVTALNFNSVLKTTYTPQQIMAMDDEQLLLMREGVAVLGRVIEWETQRAKRHR